MKRLKPQPAGVLVSATKLKRLVNRWLEEMENQGLLASDKPQLRGYGEGRRDCLRRCADDLDKLLKGK